MTIINAKITNKALLATSYHNELLLDGIRMVNNKLWPLVSFKTVGRHKMQTVKCNLYLSRDPYVFNSIRLEPMFMELFSYLFWAILILVLLLMLYWPLLWSLMLLFFFVWLQLYWNSLLANSVIIRCKFVKTMASTANIANHY